MLYKKQHVKQKENLNKDHTHIHKYITNITLEDQLRYDHFSLPGFWDVDYT